MNNFDPSYPYWIKATLCKFIFADVVISFPIKDIVEMFEKADWSCVLDVLTDLYVDGEIVIDQVGRFETTGHTDWAYNRKVIENMWLSGFSYLITRRSK